MRTSANKEPAQYGYGPMVLECQRRGIGRTMAYELHKKGLIETFLIGAKRMVTIASLESLPDRLKQDAANDPGGEA